MRLAQPQAFELRGAHVLAALIAFFGAIIAINVAFAVVAARSFPGEDVRRSYTQGLHYNQTIAERRAQAALGWRAGVAIDAATGEVRVQIVDAQGQGVAGLQLDGALRRPLDAAMDAPLVFREHGGGEYSATVVGAAPGAWELRAEARRGETRFAFSRRLMWPPSTPR